jgi:hypothetical protein
MVADPRWRGLMRRLRCKRCLHFYNMACASPSFVAKAGAESERSSHELCSEFANATSHNPGLTYPSSTQVIRANSNWVRRGALLWLR